MDRQNCAPRRIGIAAFLYLLSLPAPAAELCPGGCAISITFADGGSIASDGATITFGPGGALDLGEGGAITLGEGGSIDPAPAEGAGPDFSSGGTIVLGDGGSISFGDGGVLTGGEGANVTVPDTGAFGVDSATAITIDSPGSVSLGNIASDGVTELTAGDRMEGPATTPVNLGMLAGDAGSRIEITAADDIVFGNVDSASVTLAAGTLLISDDAGADGIAGGSADGAGGSGAGILLWSGGGSITIGADDTVLAVGGACCDTLTLGDSISELGFVGSLEPVEFSPGPVYFDRPTSGAPSPATLVLLALAALGRTRRR